MVKIVENATEAVDGLLFDGMTIVAGGFGLCGIPEKLILALRASRVRDLTVISNMRIPMMPPVYSEMIPPVVPR